MNRDEAKQILQRCRPGTVDAEDPEVAQALALATNDLELAEWLARHKHQQTALQVKFRQITPPAGLKEQIISEHAAAMAVASRRRSFALTAIMALFLLFGIGGMWWWYAKPAQDDLAIFRSRMVRAALTGYAMDLTTNNLVPIQKFLAQQQAPATYEVPSGLKNLMVTGCAIEKWQGAKVSLVCFRTGKTLPPGETSDLWLFIVDSHSLRDAPPPGAPAIANVNRLVTATWTAGDKVYLLCVAGDKATLQAYL